MLHLPPIGGLDFYPRPPRGGRPARSFLLWNSLTYFYPRPPRGGRPARDVLYRRKHHISIHALLAEGDASQTVQLCLQDAFLSTPSSRRATGFAPSAPHRRSRFLSTPSSRRATGAVILAVELLNLFLSTPSSRRATRSRCTIPAKAPYFYPRPPRGGRPEIQKMPIVLKHISIHALLAEGDSIIILPSASPC